jgi:hypothetical protein
MTHDSPHSTAWQRPTTIGRTATPTALATEEDEN